MIPTISIIIPIFNRAQLISETLESIMLQSFKNWECIVVDDGSTDNSEKVVKEYCLKDKRFSYHQRSESRNKNASTCRNIGFEKSSGKFIQFLDSDDILSQNKLFEQIKVFESHPETSVVTCRWGRFTHGQNDAIDYGDLKSYNDFTEPVYFFEALASSLGYFPIHAYLLKREVIIKAGLWNEYLSMNDDGEFMTRVICNSNSIRFAPNALVYYRSPSKDNLGSYDTSEKVQQGIESWKLIEAYLKVRFRKENIVFLTKAKEVLIENLERTFPDLIRENSQFFEQEKKKGRFFRFDLRKKLLNND